MIIKIKNYNKEYIFPDGIEPIERLQEVNKMLSDVLYVEADEDITVDDYFHETFTRGKETRLNLEKISFYLSKMPDQDGKHDKETLSRNDEMEMNKGVRWATVDGKRIVVESKYKNFTDISLDEKRKIGIVDSNEDYS